MRFSLLFIQHLVFILRSLCWVRYLLFYANVRVTGLSIVCENVEFPLVYSRVDIRPDLNVSAAAVSTGIEQVSDSELHRSIR